MINEEIVLSAKTPSGTPVRASTEGVMFEWGDEDDPAGMSAMIGLSWKDYEDLINIVAELRRRQKKVQEILADE